MLHSTTSEISGIYYYPGDTRLLFLKFTILKKKYFIERQIMVELGW